MLRAWGCRPGCLQARRFWQLLLQLAALLFLLKNIYLGGPGRYPHPYPPPYRSPSLLLAGCGLRAWYLRHSAAKWSLLSTSSIKLVSSSNDKFKGTLYLCLTLSSKEYISWRPGALSGPLSGPLTFVGRLRTSCVVPSPLCGESGPFVNLIDKTRIFIK